MGTTEKKDRQHVFYSAGVNFRVIRLNAIIEEYADGRKNVIQREVCHDFSPEGGFLRLKPGDHTYPTGPEGEMEDAIDYLRRSPSFNQHFWEEGNEPDRMLPTERDFNDELLAATARGDLEAIVGLRAQEALTHKRAVLLDATATALELLGAEVPSLELLEQQAQEATAAGAGVTPG